MTRFRDFDEKEVESYSSGDDELYVKSMAWSDIQLFADLHTKNKGHLRQWEIPYAVNAGMGVVDFGIWLGKVPVGKITLWNIDKIEGTSKVSYWIDEDLCGNGYMTKALSDVIEYTFSSLDIKKLVVPVQPDNQGSIRVLEKLNFTKLGRSVFKTVDDKLTTHYIYVRSIDADL
jgi:RimJ/RimL family protein N-acetyltransferase